MIDHFAQSKKKNQPTKATCAGGFVNGVVAENICASHLVL